MGGSFKTRIPLILGQFVFLSYKSKLTVLINALILLALQCDLIDELLGNEKYYY